MAVTSVQSARRSEWTGEENEKGERSYVVPYYVKCDSNADGPQVVLDASGLPQLNDSYAIGNDVDATATVVSRSNPTFEEGSNQWVVAVRYSTRAADEQQDNDGNATNDPTQWTAKVTKSTQTYSKIANDWVYVPQGFGGPIVPNRMDGEKGLIENSTGQNIIPQPLWDDNRAIFRVTRWYSFIADEVVLLYENKVNNDAFDVTRWYRGVNVLKYTVEPGQGFLKSIDFEEFPWSVNGTTTFYWKTTFTLDIKREGWDYDVIDRGTETRDVPGRADGFEGVVRGYNRGNGEWRAGWTEIKTTQGNVTWKPVALDGKGEVLNNPNATPIVLKYRRDNLATMGHLFFVE